MKYEVYIAESVVSRWFTVEATDFQSALEKGRKLYKKDRTLGALCSVDAKPEHDRVLQSHAEREK